MKFWWVNQKQTYRHEIGGGYLWSPKRNANEARNQFYENMKAVAPGDIVFSYWNSAVRAYGTICSFGYDSPKPVEFGQAGSGLEQDWQSRRRRSTSADLPVEPRSHWPAIRHSFRPSTRLSIPRTARGLQSVYLAEFPDQLGQASSGRW